MSRTAHKTDNLGRASKMLRANADFLRSVGALGGTWEWGDAAECHKDLIRRFRQTAVVEIEHIKPGDDHDSDEPTVEQYRLTPEARAYVRQHLETRDVLCPCGHAGIENHGDHYRCGFALCDRAFVRSEVDA